jgi:hypothetical protein
MKAIKRIALVAHDERKGDLLIMTASSKPTAICRHHPRPNSRAVRKALSGGESI